VLVDLRSQVVDAHRGDRRPKAESLAMKATGAAFGSARRLALGEKVAGLAGRVLKGSSRPPGASAWTGARDLPVPARESFRAWWKRTRR
jgi:L-lactate dehydrogenase complex protein LldF